MEYKKVKTSELSGLALDWAVAKSVCPDSFKSDSLDENGLWPWCTGWLRNGSPSTNWSQGGPLISRFKVDLAHTIGGNVFAEKMEFISTAAASRGGTELIATCRAIVAANLGDTVEIPEELL